MAPNRQQANTWTNADPNHWSIYPALGGDGSNGRLKTLQWRHNERNGVSNHQFHDCLLNRYSGINERKHQSSASPAFLRGIHRWPVNSSHKGSVTRRMFPFDDVIMNSPGLQYLTLSIHRLYSTHGTNVYIRYSLAYNNDKKAGNNNEILLLRLS